MSTSICEQTGHVHHVLTDDIDGPTMGMVRCPTCGSYNTQRHVEGFRVWFTCNTCGAVFG